MIVCGGRVCGDGVCGGGGACGDVGGGRLTAVRP